MIILHDFMQHSNLKFRFQSIKFKRAFCKLAPLACKKAEFLLRMLKYPTGALVAFPHRSVLRFPYRRVHDVAVALTFIRCRRRDEGSKNFWIIIAEREETRALTNAPLRELITKKAILIRRSNSVPRPFVEAVQRPWHSLMRPWARALLLFW